VTSVTCLVQSATSWKPASPPCRVTVSDTSRQGREPSSGCQVVVLTIVGASIVTALLLPSAPSALPSRTSVQPLHMLTACVKSTALPGPTDLNNLSV